MFCTVQSLKWGATAHTAKGGTTNARPYRTSKHEYPAVLSKQQGVGVAQRGLHYLLTRQRLHKCGHETVAQEHKTEKAHDGVSLGRQRGAYSEGSRASHVLQPARVQGACHPIALQESVTHMAGALGSIGTPHCPKSLAPQANTSWPSQMMMVWR